jgi:glycopeptide antibiotics resistance protein
MSLSSKTVRAAISLALVVYSAVLIRVLVFKNILFNIGPLRFRIAQDTGDPNFVPFNTILPYLRGERGSLISTVNLIGNIALFIPIGFLAPFVVRNMSWLLALALAIAAGLVIEASQVAFRVGVFDIDDLILNGLGVLLGYTAFRLRFKAKRPSP